MSYIDALHKEERRWGIQDMIKDGYLGTWARYSRPNHKTSTYYPRHNRHRHFLGLLRCRLLGCRRTQHRHVLLRRPRCQPTTSPNCTRDSLFNWIERYKLRYSAQEVHWWKSVSRLAGSKLGKGFELSSQCNPPFPPKDERQGMGKSWIEFEGKRGDGGRASGVSDGDAESARAIMEKEIENLRAGRSGRRWRLWSRRSGRIVKEWMVLSAYRACDACIATFTAGLTCSFTLIS